MVLKVWYIMVFHNCIDDEKGGKGGKIQIKYIKVCNTMLDMTRKSTPSRYYYYEQIVCEKSDVSNADMVMICGKNCCHKVQFIRSFFRTSQIIRYLFLDCSCFQSISCT